MFQKRRSKKLLVARTMPPLYHTMPGQKYSSVDSEVLRWLMHRPSLQEYLWDHIKDSGDVVYDAETKMWQGVDYED